MLRLRIIIKLFLVAKSEHKIMTKIDAWDKNTEPDKIL